jgi:hypothetical protein
MMEQMNKIRTKITKQIKKTIKKILGENKMMEMKGIIMKRMMKMMNISNSLMLENLHYKILKQIRIEEIILLIIIKMIIK